MSSSYDTHTRAGEAFVKEWFYNTIDNNRQEINGFYKPDSRIVWNGNPVSGDQVETFLHSLPATKHTVISLSAQPIPNSDDQGEMQAAMLVQVTGVVRFAESMSKRFAQSFVLAKDPDRTDASTFYVASDCFRFM